MKLLFVFSLLFSSLAFSSTITVSTHCITFFSPFPESVKQKTVQNHTFRVLRELDGTFDGFAKFKTKFASVAIVVDHTRAKMTFYKDDFTTSAAVPLKNEGVSHLQLSGQIGEKGTLSCELEIRKRPYF